jgi:hypothetical protein
LVCILKQHPLALSLSKGCPSACPVEEEGQGFDKLSLSGVN